MSSDIAIKVENLGKSYQIGHNAAKGERYTALRDVIAHNAKSLARKTRDMFQGKAIVQGDEVEEFWALKDINFEIKQGDRVGIIGRNGAGKSTLLKILSRITEPSTGRISINGRVASLLEVGTGFHPELTGRENIFLNGAILGMSHREIQRKFDEIVDFAEVEKFLDTPVKRYSSGMYVRLAFAVAAHLEPEILIVDEVLAVGDAQFQKKCLGKMEDVGKEGRTVLFVSHQLEALLKICENTVLLERGQIVSQGTTSEVISTYIGRQSLDINDSVALRKDRTGDGRLRFVSTWIENEKGEKVTTIYSGSTIKIVAEFITRSSENISNLDVAFALVNKMDAKLIDFSNRTSGDFFYGKIPRNGRVECSIPELPLNQGLYFYSLWARSNGGLEDKLEKAGSFEVISSDFFGTGKMPNQDWPILVRSDWKINEQKSNQETV